MSGTRNFTALNKTVAHARAESPACVKRIVERPVRVAGSYPTIESTRISVATEALPSAPSKQEFNTIFQDFPHSGKPVPDSSTGVTKTQIGATAYSVSYENYVLKILRDEDWDILPGENGDIIIVGARTKTTISQRK